jgi:hypothetical protein
VPDPAATRTRSRAVSLRQELPRTFHGIVHGELGSDVAFRLGAELLPGTGVPVTTQAIRARLVLVPVHGVDPGAFRLRLDGTALPAFAADASLGGLPVASCDHFAPTWVGDHVLSVISSGGLDVENRKPDNACAVDGDKLEDLVLVLDFAVE